MREIDLVIEELEEATKNFGPFASTHEGIAVIREEYKELEKEVFRKQETYDFGQMQKEAKQLAAMAVRFMVDCCRKEIYGSLKESDSDSQESA